MIHPLTESSERPASRSQLIATLARQIASPQLSTGARASLRRGSRYDVAHQAAFHRLLCELPEHRVRSADLPRWAVVVQCIAIAGEISRPDGSDGRALADAGLAESRFARLLASHGEGLFDQLLLVARFLHSKNGTASWRHLGELALTDEIREERADAVRLSLARDFYRARGASNPA